MNQKSFVVTKRKNGLRIAHDIFLKNNVEALRYCLEKCGRHKTGCAVDCRIRRHFKIPRHGPNYPGD